MGMETLVPALLRILQFFMWLLISSSPQTQDQASQGSGKVVPRPFPLGTQAMLTGADLRTAVMEAQIRKQSKTTWGH